MWLRLCLAAAVAGFLSASAHADRLNQGFGINLSHGSRDSLPYAPGTGGGGGPVTWTLVASSAPAVGTNSSVTPAINDTTATLDIVFVSDYTASTFGTVSDSKSNTVSQAVSGGVSKPNVRCSLWYILNPTTDAAHTFTYTATGSFSSITVEAWKSSGGATSGALDQTSQNTGLITGGSNTFGPVAITPSQNNELIATTFGQDASISTVSATSSTLDHFLAYSGGTNMGIASAYLVQTAAAAVTPTFHFSSSGLDGCAIAASFTPHS